MHHSSAMPPLHHSLRLRCQELLPGEQPAQGDGHPRTERGRDGQRGGPQAKGSATCTHAGWQASVIADTIVVDDKLLRNPDKTVRHSFWL